MLSTEKVNEIDVLILKAGMTGLMAQILCEQTGMNSLIVDAGAQLRTGRQYEYLHEEVPILNCKKRKINHYIIKGSELKDISEITDADIRAYGRKIQRIDGENSLDKIRNKEFKKVGYTFEVPTPKHCIFGWKLSGLNVQDQTALLSNPIGKIAEVHYSTLVSTIHMAELLLAIKAVNQVFSVPVLSFPSSLVYIMAETIVKTDEDINIFYSVTPAPLWYRKTIVGTNIIKEFVSKPNHDYQVLHPGKIYPMGEHSNKIKDELLQELQENNIHCIGRYAQWEPKHLIHHSYERLTEIF